MTVRTTWLLNPGQTRADTRLSPVGTYTPLDATQTRAGVIPGGTAMNLTGSTMTGTLAIGRAVIQGTATQGAYGFVVTAAETINVANGHASLNRIDSVFAVINDSGYDTSGTLQGQIQYVQGTASASPTAPTSPGNSTAYLKLWDIAVAAGASAGSPINWATALTDQRVYTVGIGGINPGGSSVAGSYAGQWRDGGGTTGIMERYNGTTWESALRLSNSGQVTIGDATLTRSAAGVIHTSGALSVGGVFTELRTATAEDTTSRTTTSTSLVTLTGITAPTLIVPPSGKVKVTLTAMQRNSSTFTCTSSFRAVGSTSGQVYTETVTGGIQASGSNNSLGTKVYLVSGLVAGETLTVTPYHQVNSGTGTWDYRYVLLEAAGS